ncbi:MAG: hypothetical protein CVV64_18555 [Candidatus Wallbacteria bacterium HGW-Wallbacteria-1]|jgi:endonuclease YncB( thermonuclease family)|uniref:TNase-like domain-containing protein n=1 Tax=Candidatus Wallbacteria bacterium HGW-Wallbacteria-1 TaxID=2013854 RepID=A0A2N1PJI4_9BACT|nr:MAG: hypothetical protein CVV64_18555 [Candidatus Wallbacteria bacterium HGW-Wallbacteria-1]
MRLNFNIVYWILIVLLILSSSFFTYHVVTFKKDIQSGKKAEIPPSGTEVTLNKVMDGDEISVTAPDGNMMVRILGIKSFDPVANEMQLASVSRLAFDYLNSTLGQEPFKIIYDEASRDSKGRILAYLEKNGRDIGLEMVSKGCSMVYTEFPFPRMDDYLLHEGVARQSKLGIWGVEAAVERADSLRTVWNKKEQKKAALNENMDK